MKQLYLLLLFAVPLCSLAQNVVKDATVWRFDNIQKVDGNLISVVGSPHVVKTEIGKAIHFEGGWTAGDALFVNSLPLSGTLAYTWEVIFRPASGGGEEQRFFHLQEKGTQTRRLFELRIVHNRWCLDSFAANEPEEQLEHSAALLKCDEGHLFPLDRWYSVAAIYDGKVLRSYVNGVMQAEATVSLAPLKAGGTSIGTRYTKRDFFKGDVLLARFTTRAISARDLLQIS